MSRSRSDPQSATGEFFINLQDNTNLDATGPDTGFGVFAEVIEGMEARAGEFVLGDSA